MEFDTVLTEVDAWPFGDRIRLMNELWDRLVDQGHEAELSGEMKAELDRRLVEDDAHRTTSWLGRKSKSKLLPGFDDESAGNAPAMGRWPETPLHFY